MPQGSLLGRSRNRVFVASVIGIAMLVAGGMVLLFLFVLIGGVGVSGLDAFGVIFNLMVGVAIYPPFVAALVPTAIFTRGKNEGAIAGAITYSLISVVGWILVLSFPAPYECTSCGLFKIVYALSPFLGALVGAGGGALGAWVARRLKMSKKGTQPKGILV